jgi:hypothetical protein
MRNSLSNIHTREIHDRRQTTRPNRIRSLESLAVHRRREVVTVSADIQQSGLGDRRAGGGDCQELEGLPLFLWRCSPDMPLDEVGREARRRGLVGDGGNP